MTESLVVSPSDIFMLEPDTVDFVARTFSALADPTRCKVLYALTKQELSVGQLAGRVGVSVSAVSHHLSRLRDQRIVRKRRQGNQVFYSVDDIHVGKLFVEALHHLEHVRRNLPDHAPSQA